MKASGKHVATSVGLGQLRIKFESDRAEKHWMVDLEDRYDFEAAGG